MKSKVFVGERRFTRKLNFEILTYAVCEFDDSLQSTAYIYANSNALWMFQESVKRFFLRLINNFLKILL